MRKNWGAVSVTFRKNEVGPHLSPGSHFLLWLPPSALSQVLGRSLVPTEQDVIDETRIDTAMLVLGFPESRGSVPLRDERVGKAEPCDPDE